MIKVTREDLVSSIAYAIGTNMRLMPRKGEHLAVDAARPLAEVIVKHLETSGREVYRHDPEPWHKTPGHGRE